MKRTLTMMLGIFTAILLLWLARRALPLFAPFFPALALAILMEPAVGGMCRRGVNRSIAAGLVTAVSLGLCLGVLLFCAAEGTQLLSIYAKKAPELLIRLTDTSHSIRHSLDVVIATMPQETAQGLYSMMDGMTARLSELPVWLSQQALEGMTAFAKASPDGLLFVCTAVISVYFFSLYLQEMKDFILRQLSPTTLHRLTMVTSVLREAAGGYLKVQCILSGVTFLILLVSFALIGIGDCLPAAAAIAIIDALPILGAGAVLLPWALIALALGKVTRAVGILTIYGILLVVHNVLQARLMGSRLGLHPVTALVSLYAGWQLAGLWGMIGLPVACVVLSNLNDNGIIHLYHSNTNRAKKYPPFHTE